MTIDAAAPAIIVQLGAQLTACAAWTGSNWYPEVDLSAVAFPAAVLAETDSSEESISPGVSTFSGSLEVTIYSEDDSPELETLGRTIKTQLLSQSPGIPFRLINVGLALDASPGDNAGGDTFRAIILTIDYGLGA